MRALFITFTLLISSITWGQSNSMGVNESIDDFFGRLSYKVTMRTCPTASHEEYKGFRKGLDKFSFKDENTYSSSSHDAKFFQNATETIIMNSAADSVYQFNKCQVDFYSSYSQDVDVREDIQHRAWEAFQKIKSEAAARKTHIVSINKADWMEQFTLPCSTSADCVNQSMALEDRPDEALKKDAKLNNLMAVVPLGNRPSVARYLVTQVDQNIHEDDFKNGYHKAVLSLQKESKKSFDKIASYHRIGSDGKHFFDINSELRLSLLDNGIVENLLIERSLEEYAKKTNFMCRQHRREEGMYVGMGAEIVAALGVAYVTGGATAEVTPYALTSMRVGSVLRRLSQAKNAASSLSKSPTAKLLLMGSYMGTSAMTYLNIKESCFPPEYLASKSAQSCTAETQYYDVIAEANAAACTLSIGLGLALPAGMKALSKVHVPVPEVAAPEIVVVAHVKPKVKPIRQPRQDFIPEPKKLPNHKVAHDSIASDLFTGEIIDIKRFSENGNQNSIFAVKIRSHDPYTGQERIREAIFKPRRWGDGGGFDRTPMEYLAYHMNKLLGMDYIPPTAYRKNLNIVYDGQRYTEGAFLYRVPEFKPMDNLPGHVYGVQHEAIISDHRILSVLMHNSDGHSKNLGLGSHWVDGKERPAFIDFGASLRPGTDISMAKYDAYHNKSVVTTVRNSTLKSLRRLSANDFVDEVRTNILTSDEVNDILSRRDSIVRYFENLISKAQAEGRPVSDVILSE